MANAWSTMEITATTKQIKSATQVEAEYEKQVRAEKEKAAWESMEITAVTKVKTPSQTIADYGDKSNLDKTIKSLPSTGNAMTDLENLARGNVSLGGIGNLFASKGAKETSNQSASAVQEITGLGGTGLFGGLGTSGGFNPAGSAINTDTYSDPAAATYVSLAKTVFSSGSSDAGETVDIYATTLNSPQNKIKSVLSDVMDVVGGSIGKTLSKTLLDVAGKANILDGMFTEKTAGNVLSRFKSDLLSGVPLSKDGLTKSLYESIGYDGKSLNFQGGIKGLGDSMIADITKQIDGSTGLITMFDGVKTIVDGDYDTAEGIFKILENFTGNTKLGAFVDMGNTFKILNTVTKSLMNLGADKWFDKIIEKLDHDDKETYLKENIDVALSSGDLDFILTALKYVGGNWIMSHYPNAIMQIVTGYTPLLTVDDQISNEEYNKLITVLGRLDSDWDRVGIRHGVALYDYNLFSNFNSQARMAIVAGGNREHIRCLLSSEHFGGEYDTVNELALRYPNYPIA